MAYMLSAQLAATTLDVNYGMTGISDSSVVFVPGGMKTQANVCVVPFLSVVQSLPSCLCCVCGAPPLLSLAGPVSTACG